MLPVSRLWHHRCFSRLFSAHAHIPHAVPLAHMTVEAIDRNMSQLPPIVMLHGLLGSSAAYGSISRRPDFAPNRTKYSLDLRNHGRSPHAPDTSYAAMSEDVAEFLRSKDIERAVVIGHSAGGKAAMTLALREPSLVDKLIVVDIAPVTYNPAADRDGTSSATVLPAMKSADVANAMSRSEVDDSLAIAGVKLPDVRSFAMTNLVQAKDGNGFQWRCAVDTLYGGMKQLMSFPDHGDTRFDGPTMVMRGGKSWYVPFNAMKKHTELFPNTKLITISDASHWLIADQPNIFVQQVNKFVKD